MLEKRNFYINGTWVKPKKQIDIEVINPATEKSCAIISLGGKEDINDAALAAKQAFKTWGFSTKEDRIDLLENLQIMNENQDNMFWVLNDMNEDTHNLINMLYFNSFILRNLNNSSHLLTLKNLYKIYILPTIGIIAPIAYIILPYLVISKAKDKTQDIQNTLNKIIGNDSTTAK